MNTIYIFLMVLWGVFPMFLDVVSTGMNNTNPHISEGNRWFRLRDGHCDMRKLIIFKIGLFAVTFAAAGGLYFALDAGIIAFIVFPAMGLVHLPVVLNNFRLHKKYSQ